jgi:hypothetical protein
MRLVLRDLRDAAVASQEQTESNERVSDRPAERTGVRRPGRVAECRHPDGGQLLPDFRGVWLEHRASSSPSSIFRSNYLE